MRHFTVTGHRDRGLHGRDAVADEGGLAHQAGAEAAVLDPVGRAAHIEVDLVVAELGADPRGLGELRRIGAAELDRDRMLLGARSRAGARAAPCSTAPVVTISV